MTAKWVTERYTIFVDGLSNRTDKRPNLFQIAIKDKFHPQQHVMIFQNDDLEAIISAVFSLRFLARDMSKWEKS